MEFDSIRPIFSGLLGGLIAVVLCNWMSRWVPVVCNRKGVATLLRQNRIGIWLANILFFVGLIGGIAIYQLGYLPETDWRGLALGFGSGCLTALLILPASAILSGRSPKEALVAYAISQKTPTILLYGILCFGVACFGAAAASLVAST